MLIRSTCINTNYVRAIKHTHTNNLNKHLRSVSSNESEIVSVFICLMSASDWNFEAV